VRTPKSSRWRLALCLSLASCVVAVAGCSGEASAPPVKIYEGGGTSPEVVDQPEKPSPKPTKGVQR